jgi:hypothetical protein
MGRWGIRGQTERFLVSFERLVLLIMTGDFQKGETSRLSLVSVSTQ